MVKHRNGLLTGVGEGLLWALFRGFVPLFSVCSVNLNRRERIVGLSLRVVFVVCSIVLSLYTTLQKESFLEQNCVNLYFVKLFQNFLASYIFFLENKVKK